MVGVFLFLEPFADGGGPLDFAGAEPFPAAHDDAVVGFAESGGFGNDFGVLVVDNLTDGFDGAGWHGGGL